MVCLHLYTSSASCDAANHFLFFVHGGASTDAPGGGYWRLVGVLPLLYVVGCYLGVFVLCDNSGGQTAVSEDAVLVLLYSSMLYCIPPPPQPIRLNT